MPYPEAAFSLSKVAQSRVPSPQCQSATVLASAVLAQLGASPARC